jgi:hypothetical protein
MDETKSDAPEQSLHCCICGGVPKPSQLGPESLSSAPPGCRPDLSNADQTPKGPGEWSASFGLTNRFHDDDTKTHLIHRAHGEQFSEAK